MSARSRANGLAKGQSFPRHLRVTSQLISNLIFPPPSMDPAPSSAILHTSPTPLPLRNPSQTPVPNPFPTAIPPAADLPAALSLLEDLTAVAESALKSVSDFLSLPPSSPGGFIRCPYDRHHRMPPESLFRHSLLCAAAPGHPFVDLGFLDTLRYLSTLKSESELRKENPFVQTLPDPDADLCFSLDSQLGHLGSNFFYRDCPAVVTTPEPDASTATFTLPGILSRECSNFVCDREGLSWALGDGRILPSEYWAMRCEVEAWNDFPVSHSYTVLRVILSLSSVDEDGLKRWLISNSPQFGIVIDVAMREHIYLLLKLCLKAIGSEACTSFMSLSNKEGLFDLKSLTFECPILVRSFSWMVYQMSFLYGQMNAKLFTAAMLKESLLQTGSGLLDLANQRNVGNPSKDVTIGKVFVSQVAAAVAALHERFLLEENIKSLRFSQPLSKSQLILEHSFALARGCEERGKRPNYRPILEHDGLFWHRAQNQDLKKVKTREELLAEERDYKRRRMSYRGKKSKRNPTEVLRDIIEEHMEEINQAGGIGYHAEFSTNTPVFPVKQFSNNDATSDLCSPRNSDIDMSGASRNISRNKESQYPDATQSHQPNIKSHTKLRYQQHEHWVEQNRNTRERQKDHRSGSSSIQKSFSSANHDRHERKHGNAFSTGCEYKRSDSGYFSRFTDQSSQSTKNSKSSSTKYDDTSRDRSTEKRTYETHLSEAAKQDAFDDRYNPSVSYDDYDTSYVDVSPSKKYCSSDKFYNSRDEKYHHEPRRNYSSSRMHSKDHK
ncbi:hypothetical protein ZIOFF_015431 [Zingiber officinale]|uniref:CHHC U11-48K-type domain-containing protein n=2 Tax=Zingiber officinale TaxID=94328 RepID=A0A8J5HEX5_ZINOF|nr:hypothetical protein ZIOFF_015431 [Zingiber officinale]